MPTMSPLSRFYTATFGPFLLIPITILIASYDDRIEQRLLWATFAIFAASTIYAQIFARCPKCRWRMASSGKLFVRSLPPRQCPRCGTDLSRPF
jgi:rubrerythrin